MNSQGQFPQPLIQHTFTPGEEKLIAELVKITPKGFLDGTEPGFDRNIRIIGVASLAVEDINNEPPEDFFSIANFPVQHYPLLVFGTQTYLMLMAIAGYSLIDVAYNDNGLSITLDRGTKITAAHEKFDKLWRMQIQNYKKNKLIRGGGKGLGQARYHYNLGRFLTALGQGSAFGWNVV